MHAWQLCHLAMVVPIADAYYEAADPENAGKNVTLMRKTAKQIRDNLDAIAARKIRLSPGKMQVFRALPVPLVGWILGLVFQDVKARILGNSIAERNCPYVIGLLQTEQMFANVYSVWYNSYRDVLKGIL